MTAELDINFNVSDWDTGPETSMTRWSVLAGYNHLSYIYRAGPYIRVFVHWVKPGDSLPFNVMDCDIELRFRLAQNGMYWFRNCVDKNGADGPVPSYVADPLRDFGFIIQDEHIFKIYKDKTA